MRVNIALVALIKFILSSCVTLSALHSFVALNTTIGSLDGWMSSCLLYAELKLSHTRIIPFSIAGCRLHTLNTTCPYSSSCRNSLANTIPTIPHYISYNSYNCPSSIASCRFNTLNTTCPYSGVPTILWQ